MVSYLVVHCLEVSDFDSLSTNVACASLHFLLYQVNSFHVVIQQLLGFELFVTTRAYAVLYIVMKIFHVMEKVFVLFLKFDTCNV